MERRAKVELFERICREAPLHDCISYYNGEGKAAPGSLAYYGGGKWHKYRIAAQSTLEPYVFESGEPDSLTAK